MPTSSLYVRYRTSRRPQSGTPRKGFTLVELLVCVAIIIVLLSLLVPAVSEAKAHAKAVTCASHLKQISTAYFMYATDYNYVPISTLIPVPLSTLQWNTWLEPYFSRMNLMHCPAVADETFVSSLTNNYGCNQIMQLRQDKISNQDQTIMLLEVAQYNTLTMQPSNSNVIIIYPPSYYASSSAVQSMYNQAVIGRHSGTTNVAWYDGHVDAQSVYPVPVPILQAHFFPIPAWTNLPTQYFGFYSALPLGTSYAAFQADANTTRQMDYFFWGDKSSRR